MASVGSGGPSVFFSLGLLSLSKTMLLLFCSQEGVDGVQEFDLLDEFFTFGVPVVDVLDDGGVAFEVASFDNVETFSGEVKSLKSKISDDERGESDGEEQKLEDGVHGFRVVQWCCTRCEHSRGNLTFCYGRSPSRKVQVEELIARGRMPRSS